MYCGIHNKWLWSVPYICVILQVLQNLTLTTSCCLEETAFFIVFLHSGNELLISLLQLCNFTVTTTVAEALVGSLETLGSSVTARSCSSGSKSHSVFVSLLICHCVFIQRQECIHFIILSSHSLCSLSVSLKVNSAVALQQVTHCFRELGVAVAERQGALALALEESRCRREEALSVQVTERQGLLENAGLMAYTQELLKETDAPCFVQAARITHNRYLQQTHTVLTQLSPRLLSNKLVEFGLLRFFCYLPFPATVSSWHCVISPPGWWRP